MVNIPEPIAEWDAPIVGSLTQKQVFTLLGILGVFVVGFGWISIFLNLSQALTISIMFIGVVLGFVFTFMTVEGVPFTTYILRQIIFKTRQKSYADGKTFLSCSDLDGNMLVHVSGTRFIKVLEIRPVGFSFLSDNDQDALLSVFETMLNSIDSEIHIFCTTERFNPDEFVHLYDDVMRHLHGKDPRVRLIKDYLSFFKEIAQKSNIMIRRYYIAVVGDSKKDAKELYREKEVNRSLLYRKMHEVLDKRVDVILGTLAAAGLQGYVLDGIDVQALLKTVYGGVE